MDGLVLEHDGGEIADIFRRTNGPASASLATRYLSNLKVVSAGNDSPTHCINSASASSSRYSSCREESRRQRHRRKICSMSDDLMSGQFQSTSASYLSACTI